MIFSQLIYQYIHLHYNKLIAIIFAVSLMRSQSPRSMLWATYLLWPQYRLFYRDTRNIPVQKGKFIYQALHCWICNVPWKNSKMRYKWYLLLAR